jgi:dihydroorotate dehydrogenase (fumarate)
MEKNLNVEYFGKTLKNPIIVGASGLTGNIESIKKLEENGAAAVVLRSIFEEQITGEAKNIAGSGDNINNTENAYEYIEYYVQQNNIEHYLDLIKQVKSECSIPVIGSINCSTDAEEWINYAESIEKAGADGLELNIFIIPADPELSSSDIEERYFNIIRSVRKKVSLPIAVKLPHYFSGLAHFVKRISKLDIQSVVLFNHFMSVDFNIDKETIQPSTIYTTPQDLAMPLRWTGILHSHLDSDIVATSGIKTGDDVVKCILAGAQAVEVVSTVYNNGPEQIKKMIADMEAVMEKKGWRDINLVRGRMSQSKSENFEQFERAQFMRYFSNHQK